MSLSQSWIQLLLKAQRRGKILHWLFAIVGMTFFLGLMVLFFMGALTFDRIIGCYKAQPTLLSVLLALPLLAVGLVLALGSVLKFFSVKGSPVPISPPPKLVATGFYAYSRNPMMTGLFLLLFGAAVLLRSVSLGFIFTPALIALGTWYLIAIEEPELEIRLGQDYIEYKKHVPRYGIPFRLSW
ncbi:MAG: methyltransferase [bacterium]